MGDYFFIMAYFDDSNVPGLFFKRSFTGEPVMLVDPGELSNGREDRIMLKNYSVSKNSKYLAFEYSRSGSDWAEAGVVQLPSGKILKGHLKGLKFSPLAWEGDGFFYSTFSQLGKFGLTYSEKVYYHRIGTDQKADKLIFQRKNQFSRFSFFTTTNERFFVLKEKSASSGKVNYFYIDYQAKQPHIMPLLIHVPNHFSIVDSHNGKFIVKSWFQSDNGSIVMIDPAHPYKLKAIVPAFSQALLEEVLPFPDRILAVYKSNQHPILTIFDYSGKVLYSLTFPVATSIHSFFTDHNKNDVLFAMTSYTVPPVIYRFNIYSFKKELTDRTKVTFSIKDIVFKEVEYPAKDSVMVPMVLIYKKGMKKNGKNPALLEAYGGYGVISTPDFDPGIVNFVEKGGIFAFAEIRGSGDKGASWAKAGRGLHKQTAFDDFVAGARYLIREGYTSSNHLAATGASHGGLVVAVAAVQHPHLFKAVVPVAAPTDMLRFEKFTVGLWNISEFGTVTDSTDFVNLLHYSPYENIKDSVNYPAMLVITAENDDRVPPFNSYKFVAKLQNRPVQKNPILLMTRKKEGHTSLSVRKESEMYGFILSQINSKKNKK